MGAMDPSPPPPARLRPRRRLPRGLAALVALAAAAAVASSGPARSAERPWNVLFIATDDLNTDLGCYGHPQVQSPHIDGLAARGRLFERAYCQYPQCGQSRASLMTGLRPDTTRVYDLRVQFRETVPDAVTLPQLFREHGYFAARAGKIYHYGVPGDIGTDGLDDPESWDFVANPAGRDKLEEHLVVNYTPQRGLGSSLSFLAAEGDDEEQTDGMIATEIIRLMEEHRDRPFFLAAGFFRPHCPYIAPKRYFDLYPLESIELPQVPPGYRETVPEIAFWTNPPNWGLTEEQCREVVQAYYASVSFVDAQVGRLLEALDRLGLAERTVVVLWSDHGYQLGHHDGQWKKQSLWEQAARAPLIVSAPGIASPGAATARTVEFVDIFPTVADLCGLPLPEGLEGVSLRPLLDDPAAEWDRPAVTQTHRRQGQRGYSIRTERWRYTEWDQGRAGTELYDHERDPEELENLAADPAHAATIAGLRDRLRGIAPESGGPGR